MPANPRPAQYSTAIIGNNVPDANRARRPEALDGALLPGRRHQSLYRTPGFVAGEEQTLWYNAAAVLAYPSMYEGFGLPPLEAMACGTPVVASDAAWPPEVVGEAGVLISPLDERAWADALRRVREDEPLRVTLRQAGPVRSAQFSRAGMARGMLCCYEELAS